MLPYRNLRSVDTMNTCSLSSVRTTYQYDAVHRLRSDHFLCIYGHQVSEVHGCRVREALVQRDGREGDRKGTRELNTAFDRLDQCGHIAVTRIESRRSIHDPDDGPIECVIRITCALDECLSQKQRELVVSAEKTVNMKSQKRL